MLNHSNENIVNMFLDNVARGGETSYMLTISRDGEHPVRSIYFYDNAVHAVNGYNRYNDWGFAKDYLTVVLYEPTGRKHEKILERPKGGECVFVRKDYIDSANIIKDIKDPDLKYDIARRFAQIFSKDNQRFDAGRFFDNVGLEGLIVND